MMILSNEQIDALVKKAQSGNREAFGKLYDVFLHPIYKYVSFRIPQQEMAEDITSDIFFKVLKKLHTYGKKTNMPFSAWLFRIAKNTIIDFYRKQKPLEEIPEDFFDVNMHTEREVEHTFLKKRILKAMKRLPETQSHAIALKYFSERTNREIADILGKSETAVRILLSRGLKKLADILEKE